jgi:hypothetical protein
MSEPTPQAEPTLADVLMEVRGIRQDLIETRQDLEATRQEFQAEVKRWDERFFQLSRDTLNFTRAVVTTAAVVAVIIPLLKDVAPLVIELIKSRS